MNRLKSFPLTKQKGGRESLLNRNPSIDESNCRYIIRCFLRHWKQRLLSEKITLSNKAALCRGCFSAFARQFMQIHCTPNILFFEYHITWHDFLSVPSYTEENEIFL